MYQACVSHSTHAVVHISNIININIIYFILFARLKKKIHNNQQAYPFEKYVCIFTQMKSVKKVFKLNITNFKRLIIL